MPNKPRGIILPKLSKEPKAKREKHLPKIDYNNPVSPDNAP
jgi:hypothetical protein